MSKTISALILIAFVSVMAIPLLAGAADDLGMKEACTIRNDKTLNLDECSDIDNINGNPVSIGDKVSYEEAGMCCVMDALYTATDWVFFIVTAIAIILIIWGGFTVMTAAGSEEKLSKGRNYIVYALVGFIVAILARALPALAAWFLI